jgi:hypothetical protein
MFFLQDLFDIKLTRALFFSNWTISILDKFTILSQINKTLYTHDQLNKDIVYYIIKIYMIYEQQTTDSNHPFGPGDKCPCDKHSCLINFWPRVWWMNDKVGYVSFTPIHCEMKDCHTITYDIDNSWECILCKKTICLKHCTYNNDQNPIRISCNECK